MGCAQSREGGKASVRLGDASRSQRQPTLYQWGPCLCCSLALGSPQSVPLTHETFRQMVGLVQKGRGKSLLHLTLGACEGPRHTPLACSLLDEHLLVDRHRHHGPVMLFQACPLHPGRCHSGPLCLEPLPPSATSSRLIFSRRRS